MFSPPKKFEISLPETQDECTTWHIRDKNKAAFVPFAPFPPRRMSATACLIYRADFRLSLAYLRCSRLPAKLARSFELSVRFHHPTSPRFGMHHFHVRVMGLPFWCRFRSTNSKLSTANPVLRMLCNPFHQRCTNPLSWCIQFIPSGTQPLLSLHLVRFISSAISVLSRSPVSVRSFPSRRVTSSAQPPILNINHSCAEGSSPRSCRTRASRRRNKATTCRYPLQRWVRITQKVALRSAPLTPFVSSACQVAHPKS